MWWQSGARSWTTSCPAPGCDLFAHTPQQPCVPGNMPNYQREGPLPGVPAPNRKCCAARVHIGPIDWRRGDCHRVVQGMHLPYTFCAPCRSYC
jgi:hypothetical protein